MALRKSRVLARSAPVAIFALLAIALVLPALPGGKVLSGNDLLLDHSPFASARPAELKRPSNELLYDAAWVFEPDQQFNRTALRDGRLPVWNPLLSAGRPQLAAQQSAPLYPLSWVSDVLPYWDSLVIVAVLKLMLAGLGAVFLCRQLGLSPMPALLAGVTFAFGTYLVVWIAHPHANVYVLTPWLLLFAERICRRGGAPDTLALGALLGVAMLGGHPQSVFIVLLPVIGWFAFRLPTAARAEGAAMRRAALALAASGIGVALGAVAAIPFAELLANSYDSSRGAAPLPARSIYGMFFPELWGRPDKFEVPGAPTNFPERSGYLGTAALLLAVGGLAARRPRPEQLFFAAVGALALLVVLDSGPFAAAIREVPVFSSVNLDRALILVALAGAMLAAYGLEVVLEGDATARRRMLVAVALAAVVPPAVWLAKNGYALSSWRGALRELPSLGEDLRPAAVVSLAAVLRWCVLAAVVIALLGALLLRPRHARLLAGAAVAVAAIDLISLGRGYHPAIDRAVADPATPAAVQLVQRAAGERRVAGNFEALGPDTASRYGLADARGHELPVVERYERLWAALGGAGFGRSVVHLADARAPKLLDAFAVRFAFQDSSDPRPAAPLRQVFDREGDAVFENPDALPRAWVAYRWHGARDLDASLRYMVGATTAQMRDRPAIEDERSTRPGSRRATPAEVVSESDTEVRLRLRARAPGRLVLDDTYYPGWRAEVDGRRVDVKPANAAFRSVAVPAGLHEVTFRYRPMSVWAGGAISLAGLLTLAGAALLLRRRAGG